MNRLLHFSRIGAGIILSANAMKAFRASGHRTWSLVEVTSETDFLREPRTGTLASIMYEIVFDAASEAHLVGRT